MSGAAEPQLTRPLGELGAAAEERFGGKSANLGELIGQGLPVPPGFAVSTAAFEGFLADAGLHARIDAALGGIDLGDVEAVREAAATVAAAIGETPLPEAVAAEIDAGYAALAERAGEAEPAVAVRSSARGEDGAEATFAGQQDTRLWVRGPEAVRAALRECWASLYSPEAISYRGRFGDPETPAAIGVAVQLMVDAEVSGVLFTCSPTSGDPSVVAVDAAWGLGLGVVGGDVDPDHFVVSKVSGELLRSEVADKAFEHRPDPERAGTARVAVAEERRRRPSLDEEQLGRLVEAGRGIERQLGRPQDVEWALARAGGELFVLQARPVTVAAKADPPPGAGRSAMSLVMSRFGAGRGGDG